MRKLLALWIAKLLIIAGRMGGRKGSSTPGGIALKICPDILKKLASQIPVSNTVVVCGTNGKTTTNNLVYSMLSSTGKRVVCNRVGANMLMGVATAYIDSSDILGRVRADYATIEIDEVSAIHVFKHLKPGYMIVTNFFRDQLDRYGEIDITMNALQQAVAMHPDIELILNADDPLVTWFGKGYKCHFYGVGENVLPDGATEVKEGRFCKECGTELNYDFYHYSQLGSYRCPFCGFKRPEPQFEAVNVSIDNGIDFDIEDRHIHVNYRGFYNIYNVLGAYSAARLLRLDLKKINQVLNSYKPQIGRMESFNINGKPVIFNLSKNPAGFNQAISAMLNDKRSKDMIFVLNDNAQDGTDISWIWDVDFERVMGGVEYFGASGTRHNDVMVRLKYAGCNSDRMREFDQVEQAIVEMLKTDSEVLYLLVNYTALFSTHNILLKLEGREHED